MGSSGVVWHEDRAIVEEVLAGTTSLESNPDMLALLERVNPADPVWAVGTLDFTQRSIGVPSYGVFFSGDILPPRAGGSENGSAADRARRFNGPFRPKKVNILRLRSLPVEIKNALRQCELDSLDECREPRLMG